MRLAIPSLFKALGVLLLAALAIGAAIVAPGAAGGYSTPPPTGKPTLKVKVKSKQTTKTARKKGLKLTATCSVPCLVAVRLSKGAKTVGSAVKHLPNRAGTVKVKFSKKARRQLKKARKSVRYKLRAGAFDAANQSSNTVVKTVKLKRKHKK